ncbi:MAG: glycosyltransferase family 2 protein, partial [Clostridia bacterium]|nr:glycosyltransferase family 2 protein [Clostridia bacterium]
MAQPKVSIIVPVYNVEKYLERCLDSLRNQSLKEIEIILVDDSSPDACPALCDEAAEKDSRIKVIHKANAGAGMARNSALEIATGEYIGFVDSDDFVDKDMYRVLYEKAKESESDLVLSGVLFVDGNMFQKEGEVLCKTYFEKDTLFETQEELNLLRMGIVGALPDAESDSEYGMSIWKNLFRTAIIKENHLSFRSEREIFSEDGMFMVDFVSHIKKALGIPEAFYNYCRNGDSLSKSYKKDRLEKGLAFVFAAEENFKRDLSPV